VNAVDKIIATRRAHPTVLAGLSRLISSGRIWQGWSLALLALGLLWLQFFNELRGEWDINPQYSYGYVVPLLGLMLIWRRWPERPRGSAGGRLGTGLVVLGALACLLPLRMVLEANPEWRLLYWTHGVVLLLLSFCLLHRAGGWPWVKFFSLPILFMMVAVPWPMVWETTVIQGLMRGVAAMTVDVVGWLGIPAVQHGNLIEVGTGIVGIDEACSGVRSLQSALMLSLFLGELYRFPIGRRLTLLLASVVTVLVANIARTSFLTWAAAQRGLRQMEAWHDAAGMIVMFIVLPVLFGLAWLIRPKNIVQTETPPPVAFDAMALPHWIAVAALSWLVITEVVTDQWYRSHEKTLIANAHWTVAWPVQNPHFKKSALPQESLATLRCSNSDSAGWEDDEGNQWSAFFLRWNAGKNSEALAKGHSPDICFPAAGANLVEDLGTVTTEVNGVKIPFKHQTFDSKNGLLQVFYCLWSDRIAENETGPFPTKHSNSRLQAVLDGKRNLGQQVLEIVISGPSSEASAVSLLEQNLPSLVHFSAPSQSLP
jgi:exosortase